MGFIDYHGNKENHYEDVVEFAKMRQEEELRRMEEAQIRKWFGEKLGDLRYSKLESSILIKYMMREYQRMFRVYRDMISRETEILLFDAEQLWKDFWIYFLCESAEVFLANEKKVPFVEMFIKKVLRISNIISNEINQQFVSGNYRYKKYFRKTFAYIDNGEKLFWRFICSKSDKKYEQAAQFITSFGRFQLLLYYYFYLTSTSVCNEHQWKITLIRCQQEIGNMSQVKWMKSCTVPDARAMVNPVFGKKCKSLSGDLLRSMRVILFQLRKSSKDKEKEFLMIEELYLKLQEEETKPSPLQSILPENVKQDIMDGKLPEFPHPDVSGLNPEEKLFYLNHTVLYQGRESEDEIHFYNYKGTVYFTDKRIMFRGKDFLDIFYENIDRIVEYDMIPEFLEIRTGNKSNFFQIPDTETAYRILKLIANRNRGEAVIKVEAPFTYEELVDRADIGACIFAFEYVTAGDIPEELKNMICELNVKLRGLQRTIEKYPERKEEIYQFLKYYIPEAIKVVTSYQDYQGVGLEEQTMKNMYEKIVIAVKALDHAATQKIIDMYHLEVMDTVARAEALREILGQDGIKVAFHTSIYGMVFSLFFNLVYKNTLETAYESLDEFLMNYSKYVCPDAENDSFNYLLNLQQKQYQEFKNMPEVFGAAVGKNIDMTITPQFVKMNDNIEKFINKVGEAQIVSMGALVDKFMAQMNDTLKTSFENLSNVINDTCEMQKQNNDYLQDTLSRVGKMTTDIQQINELSEKTVESLSAYVQEIETLQAIINQNFISVNLQLEQNNKMEERQQEYIATLVEYEKQIGESSKKFSHDVSTQIELLEKMEKEISDRTNETLEKLMEQAKGHSKALAEEAKEQMQGMNHVVQEIGAGLETFVENIKECTAEVTNKAKEQLQTVSKSAEMHNTVIVEAAKAEIESIQEMSVSTAGEMDQAAERLGSVTKDLNEKLSQSLNNTFDIFDQELSKIAGHLSRTIGDIEATTGRVPEVVAVAYEDMEKSFEDMNKQMKSMLQLMDTVQKNISSMEKKLLEEEQRGTQDE